MGAATDRNQAISLMEPMLISDTSRRRADLTDLALELAQPENLLASLATLAEFTRFFLTTCLDQVAFMEGLMQPDQLRARILLWTEEEIRLDRLPAKSGSVLEGRALPRRIPARQRRRHRGHRRPSGPPRRLCSARTRRAAICQHPRAVASRIACNTRRALDAGTVSGKNRIGERSRKK
jgi:hypothetical protein